MDTLYALAGLVVGFAVGVTGIGGGSLMTPILVLGFGFSPLTAVSTDLLYAALTKAFGVAGYARARLVQWRSVGALLAGSLPGSFIALWILERLDMAQAEWLINRVLGIALILTAVIILLRGPLSRWLGRHRAERAALSVGQRDTLTVICGLVLGILVTLSSVGAGALGTAFLVLLYPAWSMQQVIATDLAHAVALTAVAGIGHWQMGNADLALLGALLIGSIPGVLIGTTVGKRLPACVMQPLIGSLMLFIGLRFATAF